MDSPRLAILPDFPEEKWASMDLFAEMLLRESSPLATERVCPDFRRRFLRLPFLRAGMAFNADRLVNRFVYYPRYLRQRRNEFAAFHVCDHSYSQLVHSLPPERTGVFCHDLDTFRCLLDPQRERRPVWFRMMARRTLTGLQKAAVVFHTTQEVRREIERYGVVDPGKLIEAPCGLAPEFSPQASDTNQQSLEIAPVREHPYLLHVGSCIPRKRIDVLLNVFAQVRQKFPKLRLIKVGGPWSDHQRQQVEKLSLTSSIEQRLNIPREEIASLYRGAALVLVTSEAEGFGLPVIEALACGAIVVATDLAVLREVAGEAAVYCPLADITTWTETVTSLLMTPDKAPAQEIRISRAARFSWAAHARTIFAAYHRLLGVTT